MGYPTFIWYPDGGSMGSSREETALTEELSDLQVGPARTRVQGVTAGGRHSSTVLSAALEEIRIICESMSGNAVSAVVRKLHAMQAHLERGKLVGFTRDPAKSWAGYATSAFSRGDTVLNTTGDVWYYSGTAALSAGDEVVIEGLGPEGKREYAVIQSVSGGTVTLSAGLIYSYADTVVMVRWRDYYPALAWPDTYQNNRTPILTSDRRLNYTLDITLETDPAVAAILYEQDEGGGGALLSGLDGGGITLDDLSAYSAMSQDSAVPNRTGLASWGNRALG